MMQNIKIGTMVKSFETNLPEYIRYIGRYGFECCEITFGADCGNIADFDGFVDEVMLAADSVNMSISAVAVYGNPLMDDENAARTRRSWELLIDNAHKFRTDLVCGFAGCLPGKTIPDAMGRYKEVFGELAARAADKQVKIAFENCNGRNDSWNNTVRNIAINPAAWELMFETLPAENIGLEWEPAHQIMQFIDPIPQLRKWAKHVFHVHGKDGMIDRALLAEYGNAAGKKILMHRNPGLGETDWSEIISILRANKYQGTIDIEGWHDPVYCGELELTGQVFSLNYLRRCRGEFVPNPVLA